MILIDTSVWSLALRRPRRALNAYEGGIVRVWTDLCLDAEAGIIGPIRQELLSGVRDRSVFERVRAGIASIPLIPIGTDDYDHAAEYYNACRARGITGEPIDMLVAAIAIRLDIAVFTTDEDFGRYAQVLPLKLHALS